MKLIVGLGNPGRGYTNNRHNIGFTCLNYFAKAHGIRFDKKQAQARIGLGELVGNKLVLARPQTYMNLSGHSVSRLVRKFNIDLSDLTVIHDDLDLPLGKIRLRRGGSDGGHKGIQSISSCLGSQNFIRLRVGIGRPTVISGSADIGEVDIIAHVLGDFIPDEKQATALMMTMVSEAILCLLTEGLTSAMNKYN